MNDGMNLHTVSFNLTNRVGPHNQVFIDGHEVKYVTEITVHARRGKAGEVTITFFANVEGAMENAKGDVGHEDVPAND